MKGYRLTYVNAHGQTFTFRFQLYWDVTKYAMAIEATGGTVQSIEAEAEE